IRLISVGLVQAALPQGRRLRRQGLVLTLAARRLARQLVRARCRRGYGRRRQPGRLSSQDIAQPRDRGLAPARRRQWLWRHIVAHGLLDGLRLRRALGRGRRNSFRNGLFRRPVSLTKRRLEQAGGTLPDTFDPVIRRPASGVVGGGDVLVRLPTSQRADDRAPE